MGNEEGGERRERRGGLLGGRGGGARRKAAVKLLSDDVLTSSNAIDVESVRASRKNRVKKRAESSATMEKPRTRVCVHGSPNTRPELGRDQQDFSGLWMTLTRA